MNEEESAVIHKHCDMMLEAMLGINLAPRWWDTFNKKFMKTPREQWELDPVVVYRYLINQVQK